ncbi:hypothetical protein [Salinispora pacifica]|uniref:hypothetical protein n=1 Tax=Salinispora pacifica TaxID=351187 RepID=UPI0012BCF45B|nr:hypothetical protein [Salinispora pacifica]
MGDVDGVEAGCDAGGSDAGDGGRLVVTLDVLSVLDAASVLTRVERRGLLAGVDGIDGQQIGCRLDGGHEFRDRRTR